MVNNTVTIAQTETKHWGVIDDKEVNLFCLRNNKDTRLYVSNFGAAAQAFFVKDRKGIYSDILLGYDTLSGYQHDEFYMGTVVGRYANRISGHEVIIEGKKYSLAAREGGYHLHGGEQGFNKKVFDYHLFEDENTCRIKFSYTSKDMEEGFPGKLQLDVIYSLDDTDNWTIEYKARTDKTTLVNLTQHTYFNLTGNPSNSIEKHEIKIPGQYYLPVNTLQVPTGLIADVGNTPFDFRSFKKISEGIVYDDEQLKLSNGYDHSFVLEKVHTPSLKHAAIVREPISGRKMDVYTTEPAIHFYTGNFLKNIVGKSGITYNKRSGFCLETQHFPDAPNHSHFPSTILKAGDEFYSKTIFSFCVH